MRCSGIRHTKQWVGGPRRMAWPRSPQTTIPTKDGNTTTILTIDSYTTTILTIDGYSTIHFSLPVGGVPGSGLEALDIRLGPARLELGDPLLCEAHPAQHYRQLLA